MFIPLEVVQGSDFEASFTVEDPDTHNPLDLTSGYTISGKICKTTDNDETPLYTIPVSAQGLIPQNGHLILKIPGTVSKNWAFERVYYGIQVVNMSGGTDLGIRGPFRVVQTVA